MAERTQHSGMLMKQGSRVKNWKLRWFELTADDVLKYYHHDSKVRASPCAALMWLWTGAVWVDISARVAVPPVTPRALCPRSQGVQLKGAVDLADCTCILSHDALSGVKWPRNYGPARNARNCFGIALGRRTLCVVAPRPEECEAWMDILRRRSPQISQFNFQSVPPALGGGERTTRAGASRPAEWGRGTDPEQQSDPGFARPVASPKVSKPKRQNVS